jgi:hypothetical protein
MIRRAAVSRIPEKRDYKTGELWQIDDMIFSITSVDNRTRHIRVAIEYTTRYVVARFITHKSSPDGFLDDLVQFCNTHGWTMS